MNRISSASSVLYPWECCVAASISQKGFHPQTRVAYAIEIAIGMVTSTQITVARPTGDVVASAA